MAKIKKIKLSGVSYDIEDAGAQRAFADGSAKVADVASNVVTLYGVTQASGAIGNGASVDSVYNKTKVDSEVGRLDGRIDALEQRGRYLSGWDVKTGLPTTYPVIDVGSTYTYHSGDYYIVTVAGEAGDKMPAGPGITRTATSTYTVPTATIGTGVEVFVGDTYTFDGTNFVLTHSADNNQTVKAGSVEFGPNDKVNFVAGSNVTSIVGNASAATITINVKDTITTASVTGSGNAITSISADASGKVTATKGSTFALASELHSHANKTILDGIGSDNLLDASGSASKSKLIGIEASAQVNVIENVAIGSIQGSISSKVATFEAETAGELALLNKSDIKTSNAASHTHEISGTASGTISIPTVSKTTSKLVTTVINKGAAIAVNTSATKNFITGVTAAALTGDTTFVKTAIKAAELNVADTTSTGANAIVTAVGATTLTGSTTFVTSAIKSATCSQSFVQAAISSASLTGSTTFNTDAYKASYNSADECLELVAAATGTVGISTSAATPVAVSISTAAASTGTVGINSGTVTTKYAKVVTTDCGASEKGTVGISGGAASGSDSVVNYSFNSVDVATIAANLTVATGSLATTGSGSSVVDTVTIGTTSTGISATISGTTGSAGAHEHTIVDA